LINFDSTNDIGRCTFITFLYWSLWHWIFYYFFNFQLYYYVLLLFVIIFIENNYKEILDQIFFYKEIK